MRTVSITIVNSKSNIGENCQLSLGFEELEQLIKRINEIIEETGYSKVEVTVISDDFQFTDDEIEILENNEIVVSIW
jgi:hypothetical protein